MIHGGYHSRDMPADRTSSLVPGAVEGRRLFEQQRYVGSVRSFRGCSEVLGGIAVKCSQ